MSLVLKEKKPETGKVAASPMQDMSMYAAEADAAEASLRRRIHDLEQDAIKCLKKGPDYNPSLAQEYFMAITLLKSDIDKIRKTKIQGELLVTRMQTDAYTAKTAGFMNKVSRAQSETLKTVDPDKVQRSADRLTETRAQLDSTNKMVSSAMSSVTMSMMRAKLTDDDDINLDTQLATQDPQMSGFNHDFLMWAQEKAVEDTNNNNVPTFDPSKVQQEPPEPEYVRKLRELKTRQQAN